jgi:hypothetical protein
VTVLCYAVLCFVCSQWSPTIPGVFTSSVFDGKVAISNVLDCTSTSMEIVNADFSVTHAAGGAACALVGAQTQHSTRRDAAPARLLEVVSARFGVSLQLFAGTVLCACSWFMGSGPLTGRGVGCMLASCCR